MNAGMVGLIDSFFKGGGRDGGQPDYGDSACAFQTLKWRPAVRTSAFGTRQIPGRYPAGSWLQREDFGTNCHRAPACYRNLIFCPAIGEVARRRAFPGIALCKEVWLLPAGTLLGFDGGNR